VRTIRNTQIHCVGRMASTLDTVLRIIVRYVEVFDSHLDQDTVYPDRFFVVFSSLSRQLSEQYVD
jgi:hypothetical protein